MQQWIGSPFGDISLKSNGSPLFSNNKLTSIDSHLGLGMSHQFTLHFLRFSWLALISFLHMMSQPLSVHYHNNPDECRIHCLPISWSTTDAYSLIPIPLLGWYLANMWYDVNVTYRTVYFEFLFFLSIPWAVIVSINHNSLQKTPLMRVGRHTYLLL